MFPPTGALDESVDSNLNKVSKTHREVNFKMWPGPSRVLEVKG